MKTLRILCAGAALCALAACSTPGGVSPDIAGAYVTAKNARESLCLAIEPAKVAASTILDLPNADDKTKTDAAKAESYARAACAFAEAVDGIIAGVAVK